MANKKGNKIIWILIAAVVLVFAIAIIGKQAGFIGKGDEIEVEFGNTGKATIIEKVSGSGTIQPEVEVKLSPDVAGEIIELNVVEGDSVFEGQLLVRIRPDNLKSVLDRSRATLNQQLANLNSQQANLQRAQANFDRSKFDYDRSKRLFEQKVVSEADFQQAEANFKVAQNDLESAKQNVEAAKFIVESSRASVSEAEENVRLTNVFSPVSGTVSKLNVERGERVVGTQQMAGTEMMTIADLNRMEVRVNINENDIIRVSLGDTAIIDVDAYAYTKKKFKGIVTSIANTANAKPSQDAVTEFQVKIRVLNESYADMVAENQGKSPFRPGMTASVDILTLRKENVLSVPLSAVTTRAKDDSAEPAAGATVGRGETKEVVFVHEDGKVKMVEVKTGASDFERIEILQGLTEGQEVVTGPFFVLSRRLKDGDAVKKSTIVIGKATN
jgi:HlyD family secretion protein